MKMNRNRIAGDTVAMAFVKLLSMFTSILTTMILSRRLSLVEYGTYSTGNLIINTATSVSALGLLDAVNFYYNGKEKDDGRDRYINTTFLLLLLFGCTAATVIILFQNAFTRYFHNTLLKTIYVYIAFRPLLSNLEVASRNLHLAIGKARFIAFRNALFSMGKLLIISITSLLTTNVATIFLCILILELGTTLLNFYVLEKNNVHVRMEHSDPRMIKEILQFCIPMGIYIQLNALTQNMDSFIIGYFESTDKLAIYTNCSTRLPIDFMSTSLLTVLIPAMTRCIQKKELQAGLELFRCYIKIGYIFSWAFGLACILLSPEAVRFLYGDKYLDGTVIFVIYILVDMLRFANLSLILSAKGDTKTLMLLSCGSLGANLILNVLFYQLFGFAGPAIATVVITLFMSICLLQKSAKVLDTTIVGLLDKKHLSKYFLCMLAAGVLTYAVRLILNSMSCHYFVTLVIGGLICTISILVCNYRDIRNTFRILNTVGRNK